MDFLSSNSTTDESDRYSQGFVIGTVVCLTIVAFIGFVGNGLLVFIITNARKLRSVMNRFILHLAIGDLIVCIICIPLFLSINFYFQKNNQEWICKLARFLQYLAPQGSMMLLITIGINRHQAIVHPLCLMTYKTANRLIAGAWLYAVIMVSPSLYLTKARYYMDPSTNASVPYCATIPVSTRPGLVYVLTLAALGYFIPLTILVVLYSKISYAVWRRDDKDEVDLRTSHRAEAMLKSRKKVIKMFLTVIVVFAVTWLPLIIYVGVLERYLYSTPQRISQVRLIFYSLGLSNSIYNPFIYSFFNKRFRESCKGIFRTSVNLFKKREAVKNHGTKGKLPERYAVPCDSTPRSNPKFLAEGGQWQDNYSAVTVRDNNSENATVNNKDNAKLIDLKPKSGSVIYGKFNRSLEQNQNLGFTRTLEDDIIEPNDSKRHDMSNVNTKEKPRKPVQLNAGRRPRKNKNHLFKTFSERTSESRSSKPKLRKVESAFPAGTSGSSWMDDYDSIF